MRGSDCYKGQLANGMVRIDFILILRHNETYSHKESVEEVQDLHDDLQHLALGCGSLVCCGIKRNNLLLERRNILDIQ